MYGKRTLRTLAAVVAPALLLPTGCIAVGGSVDLIDTVEETRTVDLEGAESLEVYLDTNIGTFEVRRSTSDHVEADFTYNVEEWKPVLKYERSGSTGILTLRQPDLECKNVPNGARSEWDVRLPADVSISVFLDSGVGEVRMDLDGLAFARLDVDQGVGSVDVDLGRALTRNADVNIDGGIGEIVLTLPDGIGARLDADMGIGSFSAPGFFRRNGYYVNPSFGETDVEVEVRIDAGIGSLTVKTGAGGAASV